MTRSFFVDVRELFFTAFADLVADGAGSFARALARRLTFAAAALVERVLKIRFVDGFDVFHFDYLQKIYLVRSTTNSAICSRASATEIFSDAGRFTRADSICASARVLQ